MHPYNTEALRIIWAIVSDAIWSVQQHVRYNHW
jgi:hypothetical protein